MRKLKSYQQFRNGYMSWLKDYRLFVLASLAIAIFIILIVKNFSSLKTVSLKKENINLIKTSSGRWGAFSYDLAILDKTNHLKYVRTYKGMALSNLFFNIDELKNSDNIFERYLEIMKEIMELSNFITPRHVEQTSYRRLQI